MSRLPFAISPRMSNPIMIKEMLARAEAADQEPLLEGPSIPEELKRREDRLAAIRQAKAQIEALLAAGRDPHHQVGDVFPAVSATGVDLGARGVDAGRDGLELQKNGGNGGVNE